MKTGKVATRQLGVGVCLVVAGLLTQSSLSSVSSFVSRALAADPVEVEYAMWGWMEPGIGDVFRKYVKQFEAEHPGITVKEGGGAYTRFEETMLTRLAGGDAPETLTAGDGMFFAFYDRGYLAPLDDYFDVSKYKDDLVDAQKMLVQDGKNYAIVEAYYPYAILYNKRLLSEAGIAAPPKTPEEFLEVAKKLTKAPDQYGYGTRHTMSEQTGWWYELAYWITAFDAVWAKDGKPLVNTPEMIKGVTFFKQMYDADIFPKGVDASTYRRMFWEEKIAMLTDNQAVLEITKSQNPKIQIAVAKNPFEPNPDQTIVEVVTNAMGAGSENPKEGAMFLEWLHNNMLGYGLEAKTVVGSKSANAEIVKQIPDLKIYAETPAAYNGGVLPEGFETRQPEFRQIVLERVTQVLVDNRDVTEALNEAQAELENLME